MHSHSIDDFRPSHVFLGAAHRRNERKTWTIIAICAVMMIAEISLVSGSAPSPLSLMTSYVHLRWSTAHSSVGLHVFLGLCP